MLKPATSSFPEHPGWRGLEHSGFFAFRTPLLPFDTILSWSEGLEAPVTLASGEPRVEPGREEPEPGPGDGGASRAAEAEEGADAKKGQDEDPLEAALERDRRVLRGRLHDVLERPEAREAIFVAAPELENGIAAWRKDPESKKGRRAEQALVRYFLRMTSRATPFGLFSGCSLGEVAEGESRLRLGPRDTYRRHTRLDMDYLFALCESLGRDPEVRRVLRYRPSTSLYRAGGRWRYAEARLRGKSRVYHLVGVDTSPYLELCLERSRSGATVTELSQALVEALAEDPDGGVDLEEAEEFVHELIDCQLLVSDLGPAVTGREPIHELIERMETLPPLHSVAERLKATRDALTDLDAHGLGAEPAPYLAIAEELRELPTAVELPRLFQVDLVKPAAEARLGTDLVAEIERGLHILHLFGGVPQDDPFETFRSRFVERYGEGHFVPLLQALDEETGIGFGSEQGSEGGAAPLLEGLALARGGAETSLPWKPSDALLLGKLERALAEGSREIELQDDDLARLERSHGADLPPLSDALQAIAQVSSPSTVAPEQGQLELYLVGAHGPPGARLLGRFCHADPDLHERVEEHLRREEALEPEAAFAELAHLPEGRVGNILCRPVLRGHEIPFLGRSGAARGRQLPLQELRLGVSASEVVLYSPRLRRRVLPRLTSAHNFTHHSLGVYRFLCMLQSQGRRSMLGWSWGPLEASSFLPRVRSGRLVLSRARWRIPGREVAKLAEKRGAARYRAVQAWRQRLRLPRWVKLVDGDNELLVDLDNVLGLDAFLSSVSRRPEIVLAELSSGEGELWAEGPEGRFVHELVVPFVARQRAPDEIEPSTDDRKDDLGSDGDESAAAAPALETASTETASTETTRDDPSPTADRAPGPPSIRRVFPPGSEWLYAKLYTGTATADRLLAEVVAPIRREVFASGAASSWFFLRYGDPEWHLRLRFHGEPRRLHDEVLPRLQAAGAQLLEDGRIHRIQFDSYEREIERYGGAAGIEIAEAFFAVDSDTALGLVLALGGDEGRVARWQLALLGIDRLLGDLGLDDARKLALLERLQHYSARELRIDPSARQQLADRLRRERKALDTLLTDPFPGDHPLAPAEALLRQRSERLQPIFAELRRREAAGQLRRPIRELAPVYTHMFANRLLRSDGRLQEMVIYDFLHRLHLSRAARKRAAQKKAEGRRKKADENA